MDRDMIIRGCENWVNNHKDEDLLLAYSSVVELFAMLKELQEQIDKLIEESATQTNAKNNALDVR